MNRITGHSATRFHVALSTTTALSLCLIASLPASAQAQPADAAQPAVTGGLEEVVVTARKRSESVQDTPVSVTAISKEQIERYDLTSLEKVANSTPQFNVGRASNGSGAQLTLRGIGSSSTSIGIEQSVAVIVDGVYYGQGRIINEGFFDLAQLEILKGPQALFFGKNATAGVVSITTAGPTDKLEAMARVGYEFKSQNLIGEGVISGPLSDTFSARLAVRGSNMFGGYYSNKGAAVNYTTLDVANGYAATNHVAQPSASDQPGEDEILGRLTLKWTPTDRLTASLKGSIDRNNVNNSSWNYVNYRCADGFSALNPNNPCAPKFNVYQNNLPDGLAQDLPYSNDGELYNSYRSYGVTGTINYDLDDISFTSVSNYNWNRNYWLCACDFQSSDTGTWATENSKWHAFSTEFRALTTYDGPVNVMAGLYYQKTKRKFDQWVLFAGLENSAAPLGNRYVASSKNSETDGETIAGFGQVIWTFLPQWELAGGVRYTHETKDSFFRQPYVNPALTGLFIPATVVSADQTFNNWSPEATLSFKPNDNVNIYVAYKTAYKSGGFSNSGILGAFTTVDDFTFEPEKAKGIEGGIKTTLLDNTLRLDIGAYHYKYTNLQVDFFNSPTFAFITTNAGGAKTDGVELNVEWAPREVAGLSLRGSLNYNKARYADFIAPCYSGQTPAAGCSLLSAPPALTPLQDLSGKPTAMAPRWTASLGGSYETAVSDNFVLGLSADARYSDHYLPSAFGNPLSRQGSYIVLDASLRVATADEHWELAVIGKNLTNRFYVSGVVDGPSTGGGTGTPAGFPADQLGFGNVPRTVQVQLTWRY